MHNFSAVILTYNEETNIESCLHSLSGWCPEIFIVDSGSTDQTLAICRRYTERIYNHPYTDHASQWDWALKNLPLTTEWVMPLDADHVVTEPLRKEILRVLENPQPGIDGYYAQHRYFFWGAPMRGFKPYTLCLFRRLKTRLDPSELVDFRFLVNGKTAKLRGALHEDNQKERSLDFWIDKHQRFASRIAIEEVLRTHGLIQWSLKPRLFGNPDESILWIKSRWYALPLYLRPCLYFFYRYFLRLGFLDGKVGFLYHFLQALWFRLLIDAKIMELRGRLRRGDVSLEEIRLSFQHKF
ncbi:MAG: glycosyltransferase family 2 protein [Acidobacteria bacterium]|nr:glycosyltransferase family 2 protein [Acidobacteriota bacterium]